MPSVTLPSVPHYVLPSVTKEELDYADLPVIDLSKGDTPEGRSALAAQVCDAMTNQGFFYVINHGYTPAQTERMFDIADVPFSQVGDEEKEKYAGTMKQTGSYQGYKLRQYWHIDGGVRDQVENYNLNRDVNKRQHPEAVRPLLPEIEKFARHNHFNVLHPILRLMALGLELPEETFVNMHGFDSVGETYVRFMKYYPRSEEDEAKSKNVWLKGHTDFGSITILYSQPVAALQILGLDGRWRWIRHIDNALVINAGDAMEFLSGGFYRATIHRVVQPPSDQRTYTRLGAFYFVMPDDDTKLLPLEDSPVLKRVGIKRRFDGDTEVPTMEAWRKGRTTAYGQSELKTSENDKGVEEEIINGVLVKHYN
ncbi:Clavaminate synthase-like protein [Dendrothele bispora CBS 962.96]|uniref:Clavaminate synthase-like protein n=1 Tax=Dendrothele bispora (strain CBS 962.96) TaxID=1314807 RepID=A0A4S8L6W1_DENBC|nr:Clavaminate synthase-like protein [Dendrothele bispora CBS 962.96]